MIVGWAVGPTLEIVYQELERIILFYNYWCPLKIFGDFRDFYFLGQPIYWTHK